jgi:hypothetical protein
MNEKRHTCTQHDCQNLHREEVLMRRVRLPTLRERAYDIRNQRFALRASTAFESDHVPIEIPAHPITQESMAQMLGLSKPRVSIALDDLEDQQLICQRYLETFSRVCHRLLRESHARRSPRSCESSKERTRRGSVAGVRRTSTESSGLPGLGILKLMHH